MLTGRGREEVAIKALNLGANYYIKKGFDVKGQYGVLIHYIKTLVHQRRVEQELTLTQDRYRMLIDQLPFAVEIFAPNGDLQQVNTAFESLWHVKEEDLVGTYNVLENKKNRRNGITRKGQRHICGKIKCS